jgi:hypothetical protein
VWGNLRVPAGRCQWGTGQFAARRTQLVDRVNARPEHNGLSIIQGLLEEAIQVQPLPRLQTQIAGAEPPSPFQTYLTQQNSSHLWIIRRNLDMRRKKLNCCASRCSLKTSMVFQPASLRRTVQLTEVTPRLLSWSVGSPNGFNQRPVGPEQLAKLFDSSPQRKVQPLVAECLDWRPFVPPLLTAPKVRCWAI